MPFVTSYPRPVTVTVAPARSSPLVLETVRRFAAAAGVPVIATISSVMTVAAVHGPMRTGNLQTLD
jgi:hypothetical protein